MFEDMKPSTNTLTSCLSNIVPAGHGIAVKMINLSGMEKKFTEFG
jgi:hypothetical protein